MLNRLRALWWSVSGSLWLVPSVVVLFAVILAMGLIGLEGTLELDLARSWPRLFGAGADGARSMLSAIAGSMITVAGVVFSVTLVALTLTATQYSPRVIRTFMHDRPTQFVLGVFVGVFAYCLIVLRSIRGENAEAPFVPAVAVFGGMVLALVAIGFLVFFIHHLAVSIEASSILARLSDATAKVLNDLFSPDVDATADVDETGAREERAVAHWLSIPAPASGYVISVDHERLVAIASRQDGVLRMAVATGGFVVEGAPLAYRSSVMAFPQELRDAVAGCYTIERVRTIEQDATFGLQQIVDVALKALSPGINDQTTAIMCVDRLAQIMTMIANRRVEYRYRRVEDRLRLICASTTFDDMLQLSFGEVLRHATDNRAVLCRLLWAMDQVRGGTRVLSRLTSVVRMGKAIEAALAVCDERARPTLS